MFLGLVKESLWFKKKINSGIVLHAGLRFNTVAFSLTIWKYRQERTCFLVWLKKFYGLKKFNSGIVLHVGLRSNAIAFPLTIWKYRPERNCI